MAEADSKFKIVFSNGNEVPLTESRNFGRSDFEGRVEDELKLQYVSRDQIRIYLENGHIQIEELETSKNGTWLISGGNVTKLEKGKKYDVKEGDEVNFSMSVTIKVEKDIAA